MTQVVVAPQNPNKQTIYKPVKVQWAAGCEKGSQIVRLFLSSAVGHVAHDVMPGKNRATIPDNDVDAKK